MPKRDTKRAKRPKKKAARERRPKIEFEQDPAPLLTAKELAQFLTERGTPISDQTLFNMRNDPNAPPTVAGKFPREPWIHYLSLYRLFGRRALQSMSPEDIKSAAITGTVAAGGATSANATPPDAPTDEEASTATTPGELLRVSEAKLLKLKIAEELITRRLMNQERRKRLIPRQVVEEVFYSRAQDALSLARKIALELPPKLLGLDRPDMEAKISDTFQEFFARISALGDPIVDAAAAAEPADEKRESP